MGTTLTANLPTISFADISAAGAPGDMWDALPTAAKVQIILVVGFLEMHGENSLALEADGQKHYVRGGKPGYYPSFQGRYPHPVPLDLWDPFGVQGSHRAWARRPRPRPVRRRVHVGLHGRRHLAPLRGRHGQEHRRLRLHALSVWPPF